MAKESVKARERKRQKLVAKYEKKRAELKAKGDYVGLDKLPRDSSRVRLHNRCGMTGRPKGYMRRFGISRVVFRETCLRRQDTRHYQSILVENVLIFRSQRRFQIIRTFSYHIISNCLLYGRL